MQNTLRNHIHFLEDKLQQLRDQITSHKQSHIERDLINAQIEIAACALEQYRQAFRLEHVLRDDSALHTG